MELDRRSVLQVTGVVAAGGILAACGSTDQNNASTGPDPTADAETAADAGASGGDDSVEAEDSGAPATSDIAVSDIPVGGGVILAEPAIVVTQPTEGEIKAFTAICPHQGCLVSEVKDNVILCPCHGSLFSAEDGSVLQGPARTGLSSAGVALDGGAVVIS
jgi:Rieske Fe-S protein